jgi:hypothetical protein
MGDLRFSARFDLPSLMSRDIGRLIVRFAYLEQYLQHVIYMLAGTSAGIGRLAIRDPSLLDKVELLLDLIAAKGLRNPPVDFKELKKAIHDVQDMRNVCAHCTWTWSEKDDGWVALVARGQWEAVSKSDRARRNKRLYPEGQIIRIKILRSYIEGLKGIESNFRVIQADIEAQLSK